MSGLSFLLYSTVYLFLRKVFLLRAKISIFSGTGLSKNTGSSESSCPTQTGSLFEQERVLTFVLYAREPHCRYFVKTAVPLLKILAVVELEGGEMGSFFFLFVFFLRVRHHSQMRFQNVPEALVQIPGRPQRHQSANYCCFQPLFGRLLMFKSSECWSPSLNMPVLPSLTCGFVDSTLQRSKTPGVNHLRDTKRLSIHSLAACLTSAGRSRDAKHSWYVHSRLQSHICLFSHLHCFIRAYFKANINFFV